MVAAKLSLQGDVAGDFEVYKVLVSDRLESKFDGSRVEPCEIIYAHMRRTVQ